MFVYMLDNAFNVGVKYIDYATPGMILLAISYGLGATATAANSDMTKGIINRFRVMDVSRGAVLTGHVIVTMLRSLIAIAAIIGVAFALGFRPHASFPDWAAVIGIIMVTCIATSWLTVAMGLAAKTPESAGMGQGIRQFAEYQPCTSVIETLRGLLAGAPSAGYVNAALAWCAGIGIAGYLWALSTFNKRA
jgi:ABC-2 type transport system permease protein